MRCWISGYLDWAYGSRRYLDVNEDYGFELIEKMEDVASLPMTDRIS
jgi:hypothetical protein